MPGVKQRGRTGAQAHRGRGRVRTLAAVVVGVLTLGAPAAVAAQQPAAGAGPGSGRAAVRVAGGPAAAVWGRCGRNALWVRGAATGQGLACNSGMLAFDDPGYLRSFTRGRPRYWVQPGDARAMLPA